jgi:hypothetical protein
MDSDSKCLGTVNEEHDSYIIRLLVLVHLQQLLLVPRLAGLE